ncbi:MAG TPA: hypothetical protein VGJ86_22160 [Acidimicrobiales bacterium]|jgi:hypothetical protein
MSAALLLACVLALRPLLHAVALGLLLLMRRDESLTDAAEALAIAMRRHRISLVLLSPRARRAASRPRTVVEDDLVEPFD